MQFVKLHNGIWKNHEIHRIPLQKHENHKKNNSTFQTHKIHRIAHQNRENHENLIIPFQNHKNYKTPRIPLLNNEKH